MTILHLKSVEFTSYVCVVVFGVLCRFKLKLAAYLDMSNHCNYMVSTTKQIYSRIRKHLCT